MLRAGISPGLAVHRAINNEHATFIRTLLPG
jgi:hypothetical protein